ncbi:hypothetical protein TNCV_1120371 [Trichonephila clavipes]|uniref:Uncharacterized protein n=1 Tax=Trichonephila clavipes TaxID=2585209 RepID=A0A8X6T036_TRICX|nr:hypothetical protein TNCV_1120371 [Trichonephila clavipes]
MPMPGATLTKSIVDSRTHQKACRAKPTRTAIQVPTRQLSGVVGLSLAFCTQGCGFNPGPSRWIFLMQRINRGHAVRLYAVKDP